MYILVEIIHTEFQYISLIEMQKYNWNRKRIEKRKTWRKKRDLLSRLVTPTGTKEDPTGTKGAASQKVLLAPMWLAHHFVPVGVTKRGKRSIFFPVFIFSILFLFQLNLCIGIQCVWSPLIYTYIYIVTYIIFVLDSFHI